jgi:hypothetical protein
VFLKDKWLAELAAFTAEKAASDKAMSEPSSAAAPPPDRQQSDVQIGLPQFGSSMASHKGQTLEMFDMDDKGHRIYADQLSGMKPHFERAGGYLVCLALWHSEARYERHLLRYAAGTSPHVPRGILSRYSHRNIGLSSTFSICGDCMVVLRRVLAVVGAMDSTSSFHLSVQKPYFRGHRPHDQWADAIDVMESAIGMLPASAQLKTSVWIHNTEGTVLLCRSGVFLTASQLPNFRTPTSVRSGPAARRVSSNVAYLLKHT